MTHSPVIAGSIPADGVLELLRTIEELHTTGVLRFRASGRQGEVRLVRGQLASEQTPLPDGEDPVEVLLGLRGGEYELVQVLPPLPVSTGDEQHRRGSLEVHVPADLMNYCEQAGLTGTLRFAKGERTACVVYDRGDLVGIRVDGRDGEDLRQVFGWEEGSFEIEARALATSLDRELEIDEPTEPVETDRDPTIPRVRRPQDTTGQHFLQVVDMTLAHVVADRESYRPPSRSSPPVPPLARPRTRPAAVRSTSAAGSPRRPRSTEEREPTVKIVYHSRRADPGIEPMAVPVVGAARNEEGPMAERDEPPESEEQAAQGPAPDREPGESPPEASPPVHAPEPPAGEPQGKPSLVGTAAWIAAVAVLALLTVALLARMPTLE